MSDYPIREGDTFEAVWTYRSPRGVDYFAIECFGRSGVRIATFEASLGRGWGRGGALRTLRVHDMPPRTLDPRARPKIQRECMAAWRDKVRWP